MESYLPISYLNDFIFCPRSIYFHQLYSTYHKTTYQRVPQVAGSAAHEAIDTQQYSTRKDILMGLEIYSDRYRLCGKIDILDRATKQLRERKREIKRIYDGYIFQVYAQYHALIEMGYQVESIVLYDITHNKSYPVPLPEQYPEMQKKFEQLLEELNNYDLNANNFTPLLSKCQNCIYSALCDKSLC